jgi:hypothetical protein
MRNLLDLAGRVSVNDRIGKSTSRKEMRCPIREIQVGYESMEQRNSIFGEPPCID